MRPEDQLVWLRQRQLGAIAAAVEVEKDDITTEARLIALLDGR